MAEHKLIDIDLLERYDGKIKELIVDDIDSYVNKTETYAYAPVVTIPDAVPSNLADCKVKIEPIQDLHGYDKPWVGGANVNLLPSLVPGTYEKDGIIVTVDNNGNMNISGTKTTASAVTINVPLTSPIDISANYYLHMRNDVSDSNVVTMGITFSGTNRIAVMYDTQGVQNCVVYIASVATLNINARLSIEKTNNVTDWSPYENICPISGHTEASVQRDGVNLADPSKLEIFNQDRYIELKTGERYSVKPNTTYTLSYAIGGGDGKIYGYNKAGDRVTLVEGIPSNPKYVTFTTQADTVKIFLYMLVNPSGGATVEDTKLQLELGSTVTPFEPYQGKTYTIALGDIIYGGTVDFNTGIMTVDRALVDLGTLTWTKNADWGGYPVFYSTALQNYNVTAASALPNAICSNYRGVSRDYLNTHNETAFCIATNSNVTIRDNRYTDATDFTTAMNGVQLCYELATPFTIQLTAQQIQLLQGQNTLYASTGDISLTVNGVSGAIGSIQAQTNVLSSRVPAPPTSGADEKYLRGDGVWTHAELPMEYMQTGTGSYDCTYRYFRYGRMISLWIENITCSSSDVGQELEICTLDDPRAPWPVGITPIYGIGRYDGTQPVTASNIAYFYMDGDVVKAYAEKEFFYGNAYIVFTDSYSA